MRCYLPLGQALLRYCWRRRGYGGGDEGGTHPYCWGAFSSGPSSVRSLPPGSAAKSLPFRAAPGAPAAWAQRALCGGDGICQAAAVRLRAPLHSALLRGRSRPSAARRQTDPRTLCGGHGGPLCCAAPLLEGAPGVPAQRPPPSIARPPSPRVPLPTRRALRPAGAATPGTAPSSRDSW